MNIINYKNKPAISIRTYEILPFELVKKANDIVKTDEYKLEINKILAEFTKKTNKIARLEGENNGQLVLQMSYDKITKGDLFELTNLATQIIEKVKELCLTRRVIEIPVSYKIIYKKALANL